MQAKEFFDADRRYLDAQAAYFNATDAQRTAAHAAFKAAADNYRRVCEHRPRAPGMLGCRCVGHECGYPTST